MRLTEDDNMIQAFASQGADQTFSDTILLRRTCGEFFHSMPCITIKHVRIWLCIKIARANGRSNALAASPQSDSSWATPSILPDLIFGKDKWWIV